MEVNVVNFFNGVSIEVAALILQYLKGRDVVAAQLACRLFNNMISFPEDPYHLRINKYFFSLKRAPKGTFEEKCLWAVKRMKVIEKLLAAGIKRINKYLYKANEDVYLHVHNGKIKVLSSDGGLFEKNSKFCAVVPSSVLEDRLEDRFWTNSWLIWVRNDSGDEVYEMDPVGGARNMTKKEKWPLEKMERIFSNRDQFIKDGFKKMVDCSERSREIYLKKVKDDNFKIACAVIQEEEIKIFSDIQGSYWLPFDGRITGLKKLELNKIVFSFENKALESELVVKKVYKVESLVPWVEAKVRRTKNKKDMVPLPKIKESSGFVRGGRNNPKLIRNIKELANSSIADLEAILRQSEKPYLGAKESLLERMARDQKKVNRLRLSHQKLIMPLIQMSAQYALICRRHLFEYNGSKICLQSVIDKLHRTWRSPFGNEILFDYSYEFKNESTEETLKISYIMMDMIRRYGFYGGKHTPCRISPKQIASFLQIKKSMQNGAKKK